MSLTSVIRYVRALDSSATDGSGKTGLAFGDITVKYLVQGGTLTSLTTETITTLGTYQAPTSAAHLRIKELNSANPTKGVYEVHFHNTQMIDTGKKLWLFLSATGAAFQPLELDLLPFYSDLKELGGSAQSATDLKDFADTGYDPATHKVAGVVLADATTTVTGNVGGNVAGSVASVAGAVLSVTGNVGGNVAGSVASVTAGVTLADGAITEAKISTPAEASGRPTGILAMIRRVWEWHTNAPTRNRTTGIVTLRNDANNAALESQTQSTASTTDSITEGV